MLILAGLLTWPAAIPKAQERPEEEPVIVEGGESLIEAEPEGSTGPAAFSSGYLPGARTLITRDKFRDTQATVADVLQEVPGVTVIRSGGALAPAKVSIRGSRADQVLIVIDGVPMVEETSNPSQGRQQGRQGVDLTRLSLERVESIEVVRGAATGLYGPGAAAGAILIRTRRADRRRVLLSYTVGTGGLRLWSGEWDEPLDDAKVPTTLATTATYRHSEGRYVFFDPDLEDAGTTTAPGNEDCAPAIGDGFRERRCNERTLAALGFTLHRGDDQRWSLGLEAERRRGLGGVENPRPFGREDNVWVRLGFADSWPLEEGDRWGLTLNTSRRDERRTDNASDSAVPVTRQQELQGLADGWWERWRGQHQLRLGGSRTHQSLDGDRFRASREGAAAYGQWRWHLERGTLESALRHDAYLHIDGRTTYRLGASHFITTHGGTKASHGTGYRPPTLNELFDTGSDVGPSAANPDLQPEDSRSWDAGLFYDSEPSVYAEVQTFEQVQEDAIVVVARPDTPSLFRFENISRTRTRGVEAVLNLRLGAGFSLDFTGARMRAVIERNDRIDSRDNGNDVPGVPREQWNASLTWRRTGGWLGAIQVRHRGRRFIDTANTRFLQPYTVTGLSGGMPLWFGFELGLEVNNLTNETYAELENFPAPGRQLLLTLRWRHGQEAEEAAARERPAPTGD